MSRYFEELDVGEEFLTRGRTVTEADIVQYAGLSWDTQREHTNAEFAAQGRFKGRIAQQQLGVLIAHGLVGSLSVLEHTAVSVLRLGWNFFNPMRIGDTLRVKLRVAEKWDEVSEDGGVVTFEIDTINQRNEVVNRCQRTLLISRKADAGQAKSRHYRFLGLRDLEERTGTSLLAERVGASGVATQRGPREPSSAPSGDGQRARSAEDSTPGKYYEEFKLGEELVTHARTVAEADVLNYTMVSWDTAPLHTDLEQGRASPHAGILAPLLLPIVFANGLGATLGYLAETNRGALGDWWEFVRPVHIGDTLQFRQEVVAKVDAKNPDVGIVTFGMEMLSQRDEVVSRGERSALVARLPAVQGPANGWDFVFGTPADLAKD